MLLVFPFSFLYLLPPFELLEWVGVFVGFFSPPFSLTLLVEPLSLLPYSASSMARTKMTANPPPLNVNYRDLYSRAPVELLDECSSLVSTKALRDQVGETITYDHHAFGKRHDDDIAVFPCTLGEPVCGDERANNGVPFFYFYQVVFKRIGMRLSFSRFERELLTEINIAPAQLHPMAGPSSRPSVSCAGSLGAHPLWIFFCTSLRWRSRGKASGWALAISLEGSSYPFSNNPSRGGRVDSSRFAALITTPLLSTVLPYTGWKRFRPWSLNRWMNCPRTIGRPVRSWPVWRASKPPLW